MSWLFEPGRHWRAVDAALTGSIAWRWPEIPDHLLRVLGTACYVTGQGHSALDLSALNAASMPGLPDWPSERWLHELSACPAVSESEEGDEPFVLDRGFLYLRRFHRDEVRLAGRLVGLARAAPVPATPDAIAASLRDLFGEREPLDDPQTLACLMSLSTRLTVVLGGPGTGKTTTVLRLLALHQRLANGALRIAVAAPTGKAAARVAEAMREAADRIGLDAGSRASLPTQAQTIHRLLGAHSDGVRFRFGREQRLPYELIVVDEASMIDLSLFVRLVDAVPEHARLVVLGDPDQLEAIESGSVLAELAQFDTRGPHRAGQQRARTLMAGGLGTDGMPLRWTMDDCVIRLTDAWRFAAGSGIARLAEAVRSADRDAVGRLLRSGTNDIVHLDPSESGADRAIGDFAGEHYARAMASRDPAAMLGAHRRFRVLAATRSDAARINRMIADALGQRLRAGRLESGLPFLIERNDVLRNLRNGDTGVFATDSDGMTWAWLPQAERSPDAVRKLSPYEISGWLPAYAMTVHRAQGSEYEDVMLVLPGRENRVATRSWLYTAVSRARRKLLIVGRSEDIAGMLSRHESRTSALADRLRSGSSCGPAA